MPACSSFISALIMSLTALSLLTMCTTNPIHSTFTASQNLKARMLFALCIQTLSLCGCLYCKLGENAHNIHILRYVHITDTVKQSITENRQSMSCWMQSRYIYYRLCGRNNLRQPFFLLSHDRTRIRMWIWITLPIGILPMVFVDLGEKKRKKRELCH